MEIKDLLDKLTGAPVEEKMLIYVAEQTATTCSACAANAGKVFRVSDPERPQLPLHPNCACYYEEITVLQDEESVVVIPDETTFSTSWGLSELLALRNGLRETLEKKIPKPPRSTDHQANWLDMTWDWFFEKQENPKHFPADSPESIDIANSFSMKQVKAKFFSTGKMPKSWEFTGPGTSTGEYGEVEWFLGSYAIQNFQLKNGIATFTVHNTSGWRSGTRLPKSWTDAVKKSTRFEINELVTDAPRGEVLKTKLTKSMPWLLDIPGAGYILNSLPSFGGNWDQIYEVEMKWTQE